MGQVDKVPNNSLSQWWSQRVIKPILTQFQPQRGNRLPHHLSPNCCHSHQPSTSYCWPIIPSANIVHSTDDNSRNLQILWPLSVLSYRNGHHHLPSFACCCQPQSSPATTEIYCNHFTLVSRTRWLNLGGVLPRKLGSVCCKNCHCHYRPTTLISFCRPCHHHHRQRLSTNNGNNWPVHHRPATICSLHLYCVHTVRLLDPNDTIAHRQYVPWPQRAQTGVNTAHQV